MRGHPVSLQRRARRRRGDEKRPSWQKSQRPRDAVLLPPVPWTNTPAVWYEPVMHNGMVAGYYKRYYGTPGIVETALNR